MIRLFKVAMSPDAKTLVGEVLDSGYVGQGPKVDEFERALAKELDVLPDDVVTTNSCTSAIDLALHLCDVGPGSEVLTTAMTCSATNTMLVNRHARIVWCDVDPHTGCIDPDDVARKVTRHTKAIIAVDWAGRSCDYQRLRASARMFAPLGTPRIPIIEDAAHRWGATYDNNETRGDYVCLSFQAIKFLNTCDGGALLPPRDQADRARLLRWYGLDRRGPSESFRCAQTITEAGYKYNCNDLNAAIGLANLELARENVKKQQANARWYHEHFEYEVSEGYRVRIAERPPWDDDCSWWLYTILVDHRDRFIERMRNRGVECSPVHARNDKHPAFRGWGGPLPGLDHFASREVAIPVGWWLTEEDRVKVVEAVKESV